MLNRKLNIRVSRHSLNSHCIPSIIINNTATFISEVSHEYQSSFPLLFTVASFSASAGQLGCQNGWAVDHDGRWSGAGNAGKWHDWYYRPDGGMPGMVLQTLSGSRISINGNLIPTSQICNQQTGFRLLRWKSDRRRKWSKSRSPP